MILKCNIVFMDIYGIEHKRETKIILSAKKCLNKTLFTDTLKIFDFLVILGFAGIPRRPLKYRKICYYAERSKAIQRSFSKIK